MYMDCRFPMARKGLIIKFCRAGGKLVKALNLCLLTLQSLKAYTYTVLGIVM
jgi:hypothetical protein